MYTYWNMIVKLMRCSNYYCHNDIRMRGTGKLRSKLKVFLELTLYKIGTSIRHKTTIEVDLRNIFVVNEFVY